MNSKFDHIIDAESSSLSNSFREVGEYFDLLSLLVKRDFITLYKQTILGPIWYLLQPILMTFTFSVIFGKVAGIATDGIPKLPFYLLGIVIWNYFSESVNKISDTFFVNQRLFGKVYFPRIIVPLSSLVSNGLKLVIQIVLFLVVYFYYFTQEDSNFYPNWELLLLPLYIITAALLALSIGMIVTSWTSKYRDLKFLIQFGIQLMMYATPIVYPLSAVEGKYRWILLANPMSAVIEGLKHAFFGVGTYQWIYLSYSVLFALILFVFALKIFTRTERTFIDTI